MVDLRHCLSGCELQLLVLYDGAKPALRQKYSHVRTGFDTCTQKGKIFKFAVFCCKFLGVIKGKCHCTGAPCDFTGLNGKIVKPLNAQLLVREFGFVFSGRYQGD